MKRAVFFDLDGTLTDPSAGVLASVRYALGSLGEKIPEEAVLRSFIGPPLADSFVRVLGMTPQRANEAIRLYRVYYGHVRKPRVSRRAATAERPEKAGEAHCACDLKAGRICKGHSCTF